VRQHCAPCPPQDVNRDVIAEKVQDLEHLDKSVRTSPSPAGGGQPGSDERHGSRPGDRIAEQGASPLGDPGGG
jgi:hypothetical protein